MFDISMTLTAEADEQINTFVFTIHNQREKRSLKLAKKYIQMNETYE